MNTKSKTNKHLRQNACQMESLESKTVNLIIQFKYHKY